jgi:uncharacterized protein with HEPN domain
MWSYRESEIYYQRIIEGIEKLELYTRWVSYIDFSTNSEKQDACYMVCIMLWETASQLEKYYPSHTVVMTKEMRQLRNFIAHQYHKIDKQLVRNVIIKELPKIKSSIMFQRNKQ